MATLTADINATQDAIRVTGGSTAIPGTDYRIEDEVVTFREFQRYPLPWSARDLTRWQVSRRVAGTTAASHSGGVTIFAAGCRA